jgi:hypothetical protein
VVSSSSRGASLWLRASKCCAREQGRRYGIQPVGTRPIKRSDVLLCFASSHGITMGVTCGIRRQAIVIVQRQSESQRPAIRCAPFAPTCARCPTNLVERDDSDDDDEFHISSSTSKVLVASWPMFRLANCAAGFGCHHAGGSLSLGHRCAMLDGRAASQWQHRLWMWFFVHHRW